MWIDGVFSGGGVKAYAFVGALEVVEQAGYQFKRLAGTSAGAIIAALIAAGYTSHEINVQLEKMHPAIFMDQRKFIFKFPFVKWLTLYWRMGLYKGNTFEQWIKHLLEEKGIKDFGDLEPGVLKIVASDVSKGRIVVIPDDLNDYGIDPMKFSVARAVRMSASLPFFFEPVKLYGINAQRSLIVDGGVLSNLPIWLFAEKDKIPPRPFLGFQLSSRDEVYPSKKINNAIELYHSLFLTMKEAHDAKYISKYAKSNIMFLPVDKFETSNFNLTKKDRDYLVEIGRKRATLFLKKWTY